MSCLYHPNAITTTRHIPVEIYGLDGMPMRRLPDAYMETCEQCGVHYYDEQLLAAMPGQKPPWDTPQTPTYDCGD